MHLWVGRPACKIQFFYLCDRAAGVTFNGQPSGLWVTVQEDEVIQAIERRISMITHLPEVNGEGLQILHYEDGQKYEAHHDFFHDKFNSRPENGGQRIATVLMYL